MAYYAVARGFQPGVYGSWNECKEQVKDYEKVCRTRPVFRKFETWPEALDFMAKQGLRKDRAA